jgi:CRP/FNR family transcriptional regulator
VALSVSPDTPDARRAFDALPLLAPLDAARRDTVWRRSVPVSFDRGALLFRQGEPASSLVVVLRGRVEGRVDTGSGRTVTVATWNAPSTLDKVAALGSGRHTCSAYATEDCSGRSITRAVLEELVEDVPALRRHVLHVLAAQAQTAQRSFVDAATLSTGARLARWLLDAADGSTTVRLAGSQAQLGLELGVTRVTLHRALRQLAADGMVAVDGRTVQLLAPEHLLARAARG